MGLKVVGEGKQTLEGRRAREVSLSAFPYSLASSPLASFCLFLGEGFISPLLSPLSPPRFQCLPTDEVVLAVMRRKGKPGLPPNFSFFPVFHIFLFLSGAVQYRKIDAHSARHSCNEAMTGALFKLRKFTKELSAPLYRGLTWCAQ